MALVIRLFVFLALIAFLVPPSSANADGHMPGHVGSATCGGCHETTLRDWQGSHHALAWKMPDETSVLADFNGTEFGHRGVTTRFSRRDGAFLVETEGPDGAYQTFEVRGVAGIAPLQQYLVATEGGRLQALDIAWDVAGGQWYHLYPDQDLAPTNGLHWSGPYKNWNARCAECHATDFHKNYDPETRAYASTQAEVGIGCEACHGPGEAHVSWAKAPEDHDPTAWDGLTPRGFTIEFGEESAATEIEQCAGCHSRREPLGDHSPVPGTAFPDSYRLSLLRQGLYHADGSILDEVYVHGSFLQSKMYARGVRCSNCHDPHSAGLKAEGNAVCTQCHSPAGNAAFPTLKRAGYDDPGHHFHEQGTDGALCKNCHMIERLYMGIDARHDHGFHVPRPDLTFETGAPNVCTACHADRDPPWAAAEIASRYPDSERRGAHFSQTFIVARHVPATVAEDLMKIAEQGDLPAIVRATALDLLAVVADEQIAARVAPLIAHEDPLLRAAAIGLQSGALLADRLQRVVPSVEDPARSVRLTAARELLNVPAEEIPPGKVDAIGRAMKEWRESLLAKADFPEAQMAIGGTALVLRNPPAAEQAFREAVRMDPQGIEGWAMIVRILVAVGDADGARGALDEALAANPSDRNLKALSDQLDAAMSQ
jgi:predicted CXXCH cytochrome family protein